MVAVFVSKVYQALGWMMQVVITEFVNNAIDHNIFLFLRFYEEFVNVIVCFDELLCNKIEVPFLGYFEYSDLTPPVGSYLNWF